MKKYGIQKYSCFSYRRDGKGICKIFVFRNPTKLIFGKGQLEQLKRKFHSSVKVLLSYTGEATLKETVFMIM